MYKKYEKNIKNLISSEGSQDWNKCLNEHKEMISIIQHERLIHLLVTIFVGIAMLMCVLTTVITLKIYLIYLDLPLLILFIAYIFHYRYLENTTQRWYKYSEKIREKL